MSENITLDKAINFAQTLSQGKILTVQSKNEISAYHTLCLNLLYEKRDELTRLRRADRRAAHNRM